MYNAWDQITVKNGNALGLLQFARNEVYGATEAGMTYWWLGSFGDDSLQDAAESVQHGYLPLSIESPPWHSVRTTSLLGRPRT